MSTELTISLMGAVISFLTFISVGIIGAAIKTVHSSTVAAHNRLDEHIHDNGKEHTEIRANFVANKSCEELRKTYYYKS